MPSIGSVMKNVKSFFTLTEEGATPPPWKHFAVLFIALFSSSFNITFLFPFLPELILEFGYKEEEKGYYGGLIATAYFIGRILGSYFIGWVSDKKGRKNVMLITLISTTVTNLAFGFTKSFGYAFVMRILAGAFGGAVIIVKASLYEVCDNSNQAIGMSVISWGWGTGMITGLTVGGYLAFPHKKYPHMVDSDSILAYFPALLPSVTCACVSIIAFIIVFFTMPQSFNKSSEIKEDAETKENTIDVDISEVPEPRVVLYIEEDDAPTLNFAKSDTHIAQDNTLLRPVMHPDTRTSNFSLNSYDDFYMKVPRITATRNRLSEHHRNQSKSEMILPTVYFGDGLKKQKMQHHGSLSVTFPSEAIGVGKKMNTDTDDVTDEDTSEEKTGCCSNSSFLRLAKILSIRQVITVYTLFSFGVIGFDDVFTIYASTEPRLDGLGFSSDQIGLALGFVFLPILIIQVFMYPKLEKRFGALKMFKVASVGLMLLTTITPITHVFYDNSPILWSLIFLIMVPSKICTMCAFSSSSILINNSVHPTDGGVMNGLAMTATSISRTIAPTFGGSLFAWSITYGVKLGYPFDVNFIFILFGLVFMVSTITAVPMSNELNKQCKKESN